jgi:hypothetical protein
MTLSSKARSAIPLSMKPILQFFVALVACGAIGHAADYHYTGYITGMVNPISGLHTTGNLTGTLSADGTFTFNSGFLLSYYPGSYAKIVGPGINTDISFMSSFGVWPLIRPSTGVGVSGSIPNTYKPETNIRLDRTALNLGQYSVVIEVEDHKFELARAQILPDLPRVATATAQVGNGSITNILITSGGHSYTNSPQIRIDDPSGTGAKLIAILTGDMVTEIRVLEMGHDYVSPKVVIEAPRFQPTLNIQIPLLRVTAQLVRGRIYLLESSTDGTTWTPVTSPFVAQTESFSQDFNVLQTNQYFRLGEVPP